MAVQKEIDYEISFGDPAFTGGLSVFAKEFDEAYRYDGDDLGCNWTPDGTSFVLWAPTAEEAYVVFYESWDGPQSSSLQMVRAERGIWRAYVQGDWNGRLYTYRVKVQQDWNEAVDPYAKAVSVNGDRGVVLDLATTNPERWTEGKPEFSHPTDAVIYEVHVRDLTIHPASGAAYKGTFLGACEPGTKGPGGTPTGLDHIRSLGVTHIQFLPLFDYSTESIDETQPLDDQYNWGYDPKNFNAPEGSYATDPYEPVVRIRELKQMIQTYHDHGLRVIMDVVYNHVYDGYRVNFMKLVPGYYFRYKAGGIFSNGSGCGNDTASERSMMRKFIVDSVMFWATEYRVDGFRFDLMGLHDVETMREVRRRLDEIDPTLLILGEGWRMETELSAGERADQSNAARLPGIGMFNDKLRDTLKGSIFVETDRGWVSGREGLDAALQGSIAADIPFGSMGGGYAVEPVHSVAYVEAHDNLTLWDKLLVSNPDEGEEILRRIHRLASAVVLTSQGVAFLHAGQEFMRTKCGVENSFMSPDSINRMDWERCAAHQAEVDAIRKLIALRRHHPAFRLRTAPDIRRHLVFEQAPSRCVAFTLRNHAGGDPARCLFVVHNANRQPVVVNIPLTGPWRVEFALESAGPFDRVQGGPLEVAALSTVVLAVYDGPGDYPV